MYLNCVYTFKETISMSKDANQIQRKKILSRIQFWYFLSWSIPNAG